MTPFTQVTLTRIARLVLSLCVSTPALALAQTPPADTPQTRADVIAAERAEKVASLWPERQKAMVDLVNGFVERGFKEGLDSGRGANGMQLVIGGMRAAQGMSGGVGYRRSDLFREQLDARGTLRGTIHGAYMLDLDLDFHGLRTDRTSLRWYTKFEHSPQIDYFGEGNTSSEDDQDELSIRRFFQRLLWLVRAGSRSALWRDRRLLPRAHRAKR